MDRKQPSRQQWLVVAETVNSQVIQFNIKQRKICSRLWRRTDGRVLISMLLFILLPPPSSSFYFVFFLIFHFPHVKLASFCEMGNTYHYNNNNIAKQMCSTFSLSFPARYHVNTQIVCVTGLLKSTLHIHKYGCCCSLYTPHRTPAQDQQTTSILSFIRKQMQNPNVSSD